MKTADISITQNSEAKRRRISSNPNNKIQAIVQYAGNSPKLLALSEKGQSLS
jgi:hypothetical protein